VRAFLARWLDVRPDEVRAVTLSFCSAFFAIGFLVLGRSISEALFLARFPVRMLPYVTGAVALASVPAVGLFTRALARRSTRRVVSSAVAVLGLGLAVLWPFVDGSGAAVVAFYLWVAIGTLLVTSGFWLVTSELFPVRGAKRLFGLIGAGGTVGAIVVGNVLAVLSGAIGLTRLVPGLLLLLGLFLAVQSRLPAVAGPERRRADARGVTVREGLRLAWTTPHLRTIALLVAVATVASTLVDFQFKDLTQRALGSGESLAGFFGAFYAWTGAASFVLQLFVTGPLLGRVGIAASLAVLPVFLLLGSAGLLLAPGLLVATLARGADTTLRKSIHRSLLEVLFVPVSPELRRRTKLFVDSVADSAAEGAGAAVVFVAVTAGGLPSRWLSVLVAALSVVFLWLARRAQRSYRATVTAELRQEAASRTGPDPLSVTFSGLDRIGATGGQAGITARDLAAGGLDAAELSAELTLARAMLEEARPDDLTTRAEPREAEEPDLPMLLRLLARHATYVEATALLARDESAFLEPLAGLIRDPDADFAIRRRIPAVLARYASPRAEEALLDGIVASRFEVRYRSALGLVRRRRRGLSEAGEGSARIWEAVRAEVSRERPVWELQRLLDADDPVDDFVADRVGSRGELSLEHTFRLLSLVLDAEAVRSAYHGLRVGDVTLRSLALEYLEQALPDDVRRRLWPFIGDLSDHERRRRVRPLDQIVSDLVTADATVFPSEAERGALRRLLDDEERT